MSGQQSKFSSVINFNTLSLFGRSTLKEIAQCLSIWIQLHKLGWGACKVHICCWHFRSTLPPSSNSLFHLDQRAMSCLYLSILSTLQHLSGLYRQSKNKRFEICVP